MTTAEKVALIPEFSRLSPHGAVVFTGGEPLRHMEELLALSAACRGHSLPTVVNTNATYISSASIPSLLTSGPEVLVVSLDSHRAELHDYVRGEHGTFARVVAAVRGLIEHRSARQNARSPRILISAILFHDNVQDAEHLVEFGRSLGVDGVTFQMLDRTFSLRGRKDHFFQNHWFRDPASARQSIAELGRRYRDDSFLLLSSQDLELMQLYLENSDVLPHAVCGSHERNLMVDMYGEVQLCAHMRSILGGQALGNVRLARLRDLWASDLANRAREVMDGCRRPCGMLNCHRRRGAG